MNTGMRAGARQTLWRGRLGTGVAVTLLAVTAGAARADAEDGVVVSATRSEMKIFEVPASIDRVSAEQLQQYQPKVNLSETLNRVPGIVVQNRQNYAQDLQITSRGFGARATFGVRGVRLIADGVPATMPDGAGQAATFSIGSADRIEVLRGPFSVLYGNASGGVMQVFTADGPPSPELGGEYWAGSYGSSRLALRAAGQQGGLNYLADLTRFSTDGYRVHSAATRDQGNARMKIALDDGSRLSLVYNAINQAGTQDPLGLTRAQVAADPRQVDPVAITFNTRKSIGQSQLGAAWDKRLGEADTLRLSAYGGNRDVQQFLALPVPALPARNTYSGGVVNLDTFYSGAGLRWQRRTELAGKPFTLTAGAEFESMAQRRRGFDNLGGVQGPLRRDEDDTASTADAYAQGEWQFAERWSAHAGVRTSRATVEFSDHFIATGNGNDSGTTHYGATTPVLALMFRATPALNLYANYGRGFETPTLAELAYRPAGTGLGPNFNLKAARSRHYELGAKAIVFGDSRVNVALFHIDTQDEIVVNAAIGGRTDFKNAAGTRRDGAELSWDIPLAHELSAYFAYTHLDARFTSGGTVTAGNALPAVPKDVLHAELAWRHPASGFGTVFEVHRTSRIYVDDANSDSAAAYTLASLRAGFEQHGRGWKVSEFARVDNLFDRAYVGSVVVADGNKRFFEPAPRRNALVGVSATFTF